MSKLDNFIKEAIDVENKIVFLKKHMDYLIDNKNGSEEDDKSRKTYSEHDACTDRRPCNEQNNIIRSCNEIRKVKQEVIEVNKNDIVKEKIRVEIVNELREKCINIFNNVLKK